MLTILTEITGAVAGPNVLDLAKIRSDLPAPLVLQLEPPQSPNEVLPPPGQVVGDGLTIFNVPEETDVHRLIQEEPLTKRGIPGAVSPFVSSLGVK